MTPTAETDFPASRTAPRRLLVIAILVSFLFLAGSAWIRGGVAATPNDTVDSQGRKMGFNDVFSAEHYGILLQNANWSEAAGQMGRHDWALAAAHGLLLILTFTVRPRHLKYFLWPQLVIFYCGWFGLYILPLGVADLLWFHSSDRESYIDIPYISIISQGAWLWACFFMLWKLRTPRTACRVTAPALTAG